MRFPVPLIVAIIALPLSACGDGNKGAGNEGATTSQADSSAQRVLAPCAACHTFNEGGGRRAGPNLHAVIGRTAGTHPGFTYSDAMKESGIVWTPETLDAFIANPHKLIPRSRMAYPGEPDAARRKAMIEALGAGAE